MEEIVLTRAQSRAIDTVASERYGIPGIVLMENAGRGVVEVLLEVDPSLTSPVATGHTAPTVAIFCGKGNNAGDGFVIARHLLIRGVRSKVLLFAPPEQLRGDALQNYQVLCHTDLEVVDLSSQANLAAALGVEAPDADWLVDAMLGTGASGAPREPFRTAISWLNGQPGRRLAVDVPSGLDCDTGEPAPVTVRADHTCTFVAKKAGFAAPAAADYLGQLHVISIGIPRQVIAEVAD
ncbi:MAG: NAD(P)H-hydrate epimerase [Pirellulales bacterium]|nr:NAD(P)H-hydrate epimerase [Pirellulales bacterium]